MQRIYFAILAVVIVVGALVLAGCKGDVTRIS